MLRVDARLNYATLLEFVVAVGHQWLDELKHGIRRERFHLIAKCFEFICPAMNSTTPEKIMQVGLGFWASKALLSAIEMEVFTILAKQPEDLKTLQGRLGLHERSARDFLDALVALGLLQRGNGIYQNAPDTDLFLDKHKASYIGGVLEMANHRLYPFWGGLTEGLRTGEPQNESKGGNPNPFEALYADPARLKEFLRAMSGNQPGRKHDHRPAVSLEELQNLCGRWDGAGRPGRADRAGQPASPGIGFDLPEVGPVFEDYVEQNQLAPRVTFQGGSFFTDALPKADVVLMGHILHDWNLEQKKMLLAKAHAALPPGGAVVVYDAIIDDDRSQNAFGLLMSLNMLIETGGGFDYTGADCIGLDEGSRLPRNAHGTSRRPGFDGDRHQISGRAGGWSRAAGRVFFPGKPVFKPQPSFDYVFTKIPRFAFEVLAPATVAPGLRAATVQAKSAFTGCPSPSRVT